MNMKKISKLLNELKIPIGFGNWKINIILNADDIENNLAQCEPDVYNNEMVIKLSSKLNNSKEDYLINILIHELVHCRILIAKIKSDKIINDEEEYAVNDITSLVDYVIKKKKKR